MEVEIWKSIKDYPNYEVSNLGNVKSLNYRRSKNEKLLKPAISKTGYLNLTLRKDNKSKNYKVHQLCAMAFLNHKPCGMELVINHINFNRLDNRIENLEIVTTRENSNKKHMESISQYTGVSFKSSHKKWFAQIVVKKKLLFLGYFTNELEASQAYQNKLNQINTNQN